MTMLVLIKHLKINTILEAFCVIKCNEKKFAKKKNYKIKVHFTYNVREKNKSLS